MCTLFRIWYNFYDPVLVSSSLVLLVFCNLNFESQIKSYVKLQIEANKGLAHFYNMTELNAKVHKIDNCNQ